MNVPKKHHHVPQLLLRRFAPPGTNHLYVFDKTTNKVFRSNIEDVAAQNRLYEFTVAGRAGSIEEGLARFESIVAEALANVALLDNISHIDQDEREVIGAFVAQLILRSPHAAAKQRDMVSKMRAAIRKRGWDPDSLDQLKVFDRDEEKAFTALTLSENTLHLLPAVLAKDWTLQTAPVECPFFISDNPVVMYNHARRPGRGNLGLLSDGIEVFLPLSSTRCLAMRCTSLRERITTAAVAYYVALIMGRRPPIESPSEGLEYIRDVAQGTPRVLQPDNVVFNNSLQVSRAERFVYASTDNFDLVREMLRDHPHFTTGPRVEVFDRVNISSRKARPDSNGQR